MGQGLEMHLRVEWPKLLIAFEKSDYQYLIIHCCSKG